MKDDIKIFIIKCILITISAIIILNCLPVKRYKFIDDKTRCDLINGKIEYICRHSKRWI